MCLLIHSLYFYLSPIAPEQVPVPTFTTLPDIVIISWTVPLKPNGVIIQYAIYRAILGGTFSFLDSVSVTQDLQYNDTNVQPYTQYQYYIEASTTAGSTAGNPATVLTEQSGLSNCLYYESINMAGCLSVYLYVSVI